MNIIFTSDMNPTTGARRWKAVKRPGFGAADPIATGTAIYTVTPPGSSVVGIIKTGTNTIRGFFGTTEDGSDTTVTGSSGSSRMKEFTDSSGTPTWAVTVAAATANRKSFLYTTGGGLVQITDAEFPNGVVTGQPAFLDGYLFWMTFDLGRIYNSDLNAPTAYTSTGFLTTTSGDRGCGLANYKDKILAIGSNYIEFYENVGNPTGSPLQQIDQIRIVDYGAGTGSANGDLSHRYLSALDSFFWINNRSNNSGPGVYMLEGYRPKKISNQYIDMSLADDANAFIAGTGSIFGLNYLFVSSTSLMAYCFETGTWTTWETTTIFGVLNSHIVPSAGELANPFALYLYVVDSRYQLDTGSLSVSTISYTDNDVAYSAIIQTRPIDFGTNNRKRLNRLTLIGADSRETSTCGISWSDDDGQNWSTARNVDMNDARPTLTRLGAFRRRQFRFTNSSDAPQELEAMELDYDELAT